MHHVTSFLALAAALVSGEHTQDDESGALLQSLQLSTVALSIDGEGETLGYLPLDEADEKNTQVQVEVDASSAASKVIFTSGHTGLDTNDDAVDDDKDIQLVVNCRNIDIFYQDFHIGDEVSGVGPYGECQTGNESSYYLIDESDEHVGEFGKLIPGTEGELTLVESPLVVDDPPWGSKKVYRVESAVMKSTGTELMQARGGGFQGVREMSVLIMFLDYNNSQIVPTESEVWASIYGEEGSFSDMIDQASFGRILAPKSRAKSVRVKIDKSWPTSGPCPYSNAATNAEKLMSVQHPDVSVSNYKFHVFVIPTNPSAGCGGAGLASVGCGHPSKMDNGLPCKSWFGSAGAFAMSHKLGQNLGLLHSFGEAGKQQISEYGNPALSMGTSYRMPSFSIAARFQMKILRDNTEYIEWDRQPAQFRIASMSADLGTLATTVLGVRMKCAGCTPKVATHAANIGGDLWISFRGDAGHSAKVLKPQFQNRVYVHLARKCDTVSVGKGTEMWSALVQGETYFSRELGASVRVCSISGQVATVAVSTSVPKCDLQIQGLEEMMRVGSK